MVAASGNRVGQDRKQVRPIGPAEGQHFTNGAIRNGPTNRPRGWPYDLLFKVLLTTDCWITCVSASAREFEEGFHLLGGTNAHTPRLQAHFPIFPR